MRFRVAAPGRAAAAERAAATSSRPTAATPPARRCTASGWRWRARWSSCRGARSGSRTCRRGGVRVRVRAGLEAARGRPKRDARVAGARWSALVSRLTAAALPGRAAAGARRSRARRRRRQGRRAVQGRDRGLELQGARAGGAGARQARRSRGGAVPDQGARRQNKTVRGIAAQALGQLGDAARDRSAARPAAARERPVRARRRPRRRWRRWPAAGARWAGKRGAKIYLNFGPFIGRREIGRARGGEDHPGGAARGSSASCRS